METNNNTPNQHKTKTDSKYTGIRLTKSTAAKLKKVLAQVNKKDFGNTVKIDIQKRLQTLLFQKWQSN